MRLAVLIAGVGLAFLATCLTTSAVGKPRGPITGSQATGAFIGNLLWAIALVYLYLSGE